VQAQLDSNDSDAGAVLSLTVQISVLRPAVPLLRAAGELKLATAPKLLDVATREPGKRPLARVLDLSKLSAMDTQAVPALVDLAYQAGEADIGLYLVAGAVVAPALHAARRVAALRPLSRHRRRRARAALLPQREHPTDASEHRAPYHAGAGRRGLNHALQLAMSVAAGAAKLTGLTPAQAADAMSSAAADNVSLAAIHSEPVSNWKGISPGITAQRAVYTAALAQRGVTGPRGIIGGPNGLEQLFGQHIDLRLDDPALKVVVDTYLKKYCALIHGQALIETVLTLAAEHTIHYLNIEAVDIEVFQTAYDIAGGGSFGSKDAPNTKEQADYNLKYLAAAAFIDGQVGPNPADHSRSGDHGAARRQTLAS
jgi:anti-anti-sigma regulatory factor